MWYLTIIKHDINNRILKVVIPAFNLEITQPKHDELENLSREDIIKYAQNKLRQHILKLSNRGESIHIKQKLDDYKNLLSHGDSIIKMHVEIDENVGFFAKNLPRLSAALFILGVLLYNLLEFFAVETSHKRNIGATLLSLIGAAFSVMVPLFIFAYSGATSNAAILGKWLDNLLCNSQKSHDINDLNTAELGQADHDNRLTDVALISDGDDNIYNITSAYTVVEKKVCSNSEIKSSTNKIVSVLLLSTPAVGAVIFRSLAMYQNMHAVGNKLNAEDNFHLNDAIIECLAISMATLEFIGGTSVNLSFFLQAAPWLEKKLTHLISNCRNKISQSANTISSNFSLEPNLTDETHSTHDNTEAGSARRSLSF